MHRACDAEAPSRRSATPRVAGRGEARPPRSAPRLLGSQPRSRAAAPRSTRVCGAETSPLRAARLGKTRQGVSPRPGAVPTEAPHFARASFPATPAARMTVACSGAGAARATPARKATPGPLQSCSRASPNNCRRCELPAALQRCKARPVRRRCALTRPCNAAALRRRSENLRAVRRAAGDSRRCGACPCGARAALLPLLRPGAELLWSLDTGLVHAPPRRARRCRPKLLRSPSGLGPRLILRRALPPFTGPAVPPPLRCSHTRLCRCYVMLSVCCSDAAECPSLRCYPAPRAALRSATLHKPHLSLPLYLYVSQMVLLNAIMLSWLHVRRFRAVLWLQLGGVRRLAFSPT